MENNFYVYIYLNPRKSGNYKYGSYEFEYEPFYVGKGCGNRLKMLEGRNKYFLNKINKILNCNLKPIIIKIKDNLTEKQSFILESELINIIGRNDLSFGPLINFTNGGEGSSGYKHTYKTKRQMSNLKMGKNNPFYGKHHSEKTKNILSEINCNEKHPFYGKHHSKESNIKRSEKMKGENSQNSILTKKIVINILKDLREKILNQKEIAKKFFISEQTISHIKTRKRWSHVRIV